MSPGFCIWAMHFNFNFSNNDLAILRVVLPNTRRSDKVWQNRSFSFRKVVLPRAGSVVALLIEENRNWEEIMKSIKRLRVTLQLLFLVFLLNISGPWNEFPDQITTTKITIVRLQFKLIKGKNYLFHWILYRKWTDLSIF